MKKVNILGVTTLAGTLLLTSVGTASAAENHLSHSQIQNSASSYIQSHGINLKQGSKILITKSSDIGGDVPNGYTPVMFGEEGHNGPSYILVNETNGDIINPDAKSHNAKLPDQVTKNQNEKQSANAIGHAKNQQPKTNKTQSQTQPLPETGKESNSTTITTIASLLLAIGGLLTFKRVANNK